VVISRQRLLRFEPETPNVELEGITAERLDFAALRFHRAEGK
jgi:hypothetical protein